MRFPFPYRVELVLITGATVTVTIDNEQDYSVAMDLWRHQCPAISEIATFDANDIGIQAGITDAECQRRHEAYEAMLASGYVHDLPS